MGHIPTKGGKQSTKPQTDVQLSLLMQTDASFLSALRQFSIIMQSSDTFHFPPLSFLYSLSSSLRISCLMQHKLILNKGRGRGGAVGRTGKNRLGKGGT